MSNVRPPNMVWSEQGCELMSDLSPDHIPAMTTEVMNAIKENA